MLSLQSELYSRLSSLSCQVYDHVPQDASAPYVVIGEDLLTEFDDDDVTGFEVVSTIHIWSAYRGMHEAKQIMADIYDALHRQDFDIVGYNVLDCQCIYQNTDVQTDGLTRHGVMRFRFLMQEV